MMELTRRYWRGEVPLRRVFLFDMLVMGTMVNLFAGAVALVLYASEVLGWPALFVVLLPLPYNLILCVSVWRAAARQRSALAEVARLGSAIWFCAVLFV